MTFMKLDGLADAKEAENVPEGEYDLVVLTFNPEYVSKSSGKTSMHAVIGIEGAEVPNPAPLNLYLGIPHKDDNEKQASFKMLQTRRFLECFGIPYEDDGFDPDDVVGARGKAFITLSADEYTDEKTGETKTTERNEIRLPRLSAE